MRNVEERRLGVRPHVVDTTITPPHGRRLRPRVAAVQPFLGRMIRRVVPSNFPSSTVDGGRFVPRFVPHGRHSRVLAVDAPSAASRRPGPRRPRPRPWCLVGAPARRRRRGAFCGNGRAEHAADPPRVAPDRCYGRILTLDVLGRPTASELSTAGAAGGWGSASTSRSAWALVWRRPTRRRRRWAGPGGASTRRRGSQNPHRACGACSRGRGGGCPPALGGGCPSVCEAAHRAVWW